MRKSTIWHSCLDCGAEAEFTLVRGETEFDDSYEGPDACPECGAEFDDGGPSDASLRQQERRQMGAGG